jgi:hypothetical protein
VNVDAGSIDAIAGGDVEARMLPLGRTVGKDLD